MTKEEYITDLVSQNLTGKEIVELASRFGEEEEEEVKTEVVANQTGAAVTTTNQRQHPNLWMANHYQTRRKQLLL